MRPTDPTGDGGRDPTGDGGQDPTGDGGRDPTDDDGRDPTDDDGLDGGTPASGLGLAAGIAMVGANSAGWNGGALAAGAFLNPPDTVDRGDDEGAHARCTPAMYPHDPISCMVKRRLQLGVGF